MSPSWRDRVSVFFAPGHVHLARYGKGWRHGKGRQKIDRHRRAYLDALNAKRRGGATPRT